MVHDGHKTRRETSLLSFLRHLFGFTPHELTVALFLSTCFLVGLGIRWLRTGSPVDPGMVERFDYSQSDSIFLQRSHTPAPESLAVSSRRTSPQSRQRSDALLVEHSININVASKTELMRLPGIGPAYADRIVRFRSEKGPFRTARDLLKVAGIGKKRFSRIEPYITTR